ncbi:Uncharacterized protein Fot_08093 [Forsythia ovata]|uniref:Uncharacterized protein n=1 Tax=Forsythia ovata TaxID=205694 RepID=A0ABD1WXN5_9LAMI
MSVLTCLVLRLIAEYLSLLEKWQTKLGGQFKITAVSQHSEQSAFSRYNTSSNVFQTPNGITGSSSVVDCSVECAKSGTDGLHPYHHCHKFHNLEQPPPTDHDESSLKNLTAYAPQCGSSNVFGGPMDANPRNYSLNEPASGSKHGSNGKNGSSTAVNAVGTNAESDLGQAGKSGSGDASGCGSGNRRDALQNAALNKIGQKRKER